MDEVGREGAAKGKLVAGVQRVPGVWGVDVGYKECWSALRTQLWVA